MFLLSTESLRGYGLNRIFRFAKEAGFEGLELVLDLRSFDTQNPEYVNELIKQEGIAVQVVRTFSNGSIAQNVLAFEVASKIGAKIVVLEPPKLFDFKSKDWMKKQVPLFRKKYGLKIALKNGPSEYLWGLLPGRSMNSIPDLQNFKEVCLDISNLYGKKIDLMRAYELVRPYLVHVELSNVNKGLDHWSLEEGIMPLESFLTKLAKDRYAGTIALSVRPKALAAGADETMMKNLGKALKFYERYIK